MNVRLFLAQRISALIMAPLVLLHLAVMVIAVRNGLTAEEILSRTRGSLLWGAVYGLFVVAVSVHAAIGLRNIAVESLPIGDKAATGIMHAAGLLLLVMGAWAVFAVVTA